MYPTEMRATGHAACAAISKFLSFCAPYLVLSDKVSLTNIGLIMGLMNLTAAVTAQFLPAAGGDDIQLTVSFQGKDFYNYSGCTGELTENEDGDGLKDNSGHEDEADEGTGLSSMNRIGSGSNGVKRAGNIYSPVPTLSTRGSNSSLVSSALVGTSDGGVAGGVKGVIKGNSSSNGLGTKSNSGMGRAQIEMRESVARKATGTGGVIGASGTITARSEVKKTTAGLSGSVQKEQSVLSKLHSPKK